MKALPLGYNVLVKREAVQKVTPGGIVIADIAQDKGNKGLVVAVGGFVSLVKPGDSVIIGKYAGLELTDNGPEFTSLVLLQDDDIKMLLSETDGFELDEPPTEG